METDFKKRVKGGGGTRKNDILFFLKRIMNPLSWGIYLTTALLRG